MLRTLLTTTALASLMATGAIAQDAAPATDAPAMDAPATTEVAPVEGTVDFQSILATGYTVTDVDNLATEIIGKQVYSSAATDAENIGNINNLVVGETGDVAAVIIGVGGFLGIGEKNVAVNYAELEWVTAEDGSERYVLATTKEALETAPAFETRDDGDMAAAPADNTMAAPADSTMVAEDNNGIATGPIDRDALVDAPLTAEELIGTNAYGPGDEHLGAIGDVILADDGSTVDALVIDFGGFLGIGTKPVAVGIDNVRYATDADGREYLFINVTREQLDAAVAYDAATWATARDTQLLATDPLS
ncbi:MAG: PRC-barrel domain-containing protein [Devosia sp.]